MSIVTRVGTVTGRRDHEIGYEVRAVRDHPTSWLLTLSPFRRSSSGPSNLDDGLRKVAMVIGAYVDEDEPQVEVVVDFAASSQRTSPPAHDAVWRRQA